MSHPREAIYDVLQAKKQRSEAAAAAKRTTAVADEWARYEADNAAARDSYNGVRPVDRRFAS